MYKSEQSKNEFVLTIWNNTKSKFAIWSICIVAFVVICIPIVVFILLIKQSEGIPFGFVITCFISLFVVCYLVRLALWNIGGKEIIIIKQKNISLTNDYIFFREKIKAVDFTKLEIFFMRNDEFTHISLQKQTKEPDSRIYFKIDDDFIDTNSVLPISDIMLINNSITEFLNGIFSPVRQRL